MSMIRVDYDNAQAQAKKLDSTIADCEIAIQRLKMVIAKIPPCWEGDAASIFLIAMQKRIQEIQRIRDRAEQMAILIRRVADDFEESERRMKDLFGAVSQGATSTSSNGDGSGGGFSSGAGVGGGAGGGGLGF